MSEPVPGSDSAIAAILMWPARRRPESRAELVLLLVVAHPGDRRRGEVGAAERERDAGAAPGELLGCDHAEPGLSLGLARIGVLLDAGQALAAVEHGGLRHADALRRLHQIPGHRLVLVVLDRDRPHHLLGERAEHLANALEHGVVVEDVHRDS
jgi:hypothetical protein